MTLQQILTQARLLINQQVEASSDFTDAMLTGYANEGLRYIATLVSYPRDIVSIQVQSGLPAYNLPADFMRLRTAYFGDATLAGDLEELIITTEENLAQVHPNWIETNSEAYGRPEYIILLDRVTVLLFPTPNAVESVANKKLHMGYVFYPTALSAGGDSPGLPLVYHDLLPVYVQYKCYAGVLTKPELATQIFDEISKRAKVLDPAVTKELERMQFMWGSTDSPNTDADGVLIP